MQHIQPMTAMLILPRKWSCSRKPEKMDCPARKAPSSAWLVCHFRTLTVWPLSRDTKTILEAEYQVRPVHVNRA
ncbi:hypothetical protein DPMN_082575 [Dreissena polymorpha]|uniref:Uncharacterized protein n=1 Tax=Dreissena polymorpha TaxID=45954 RepID=A0A9D3YB73_DREPO|nr:hypothetical protein DPMN_082575 [Dreissena polymorpha]